MTPEEIQAKIDEATKGLKDKNTELLGKLAKSKELLDKIDGLDLDKLIKDSKAFADFQKKSDEEKGEYKKLYEQLKASSDVETKKLSDKVLELEGQIVNSKKQSAITKALSEVKVDPLLLDIAVKDITGKAAVDDKGNVMIDGKDLQKFTKEWSESDIGKRFIVSGNSGGGSNGGSDGGPDGFSKYFDPKSEHYNVTKQAELAKSNISEYNRLKGIHQKRN